MWQSIFTMHNLDSMFLLTEYFFKVCLGCTSPCNVPVVNVGMYVRMIQWQQRMFISIGLLGDLHTVKILVALVLNLAEYHM